DNLIEQRYDRTVIRNMGVSEPKGAAPSGLSSEERATREDGASKAPGGERGIGGHDEPYERGSEGGRGGGWANAGHRPGDPLPGAAEGNISGREGRYRPRKEFGG